MGAARQLWESWSSDEHIADQQSGRFVRSESPGAFSHSGQQFDFHGNFTLPRSPQVHPVIRIFLAPHLTPTGLDGFVDSVVPLLREGGVLRSEYTTTTLRGHLGLAPAGTWATAQSISV